MCDGEGRLAGVVSCSSDMCRLLSWFVGCFTSRQHASGQWAEFLFCTGTGQPRPAQSPAALQAGSGEPKARVLTWHLSMGV